MGGWNGWGASFPFQCFNQKFPARPPPTRSVINNSTALSLSQYLSGVQCNKWVQSWRKSTIHCYMTHRSCILHHWLKFCCLQTWNGVRFQQKFWNDSCYHLHISRTTNPLNSPDGENQGQREEGRRPEQDSRKSILRRTDSRLTDPFTRWKNSIYITLIIPKTISISFDASVQSRCHGQPHHSIACSYSSALVKEQVKVEIE